MPRPSKCRKVCRLPRAAEFIPVNGTRQKPAVVMTIDEYETIRLIDRQGFSQEECGSYMQIARTTVQQIYTSARGKLAEALVDGAPLKIEGGNFRLCDGREEACGCGGCQKHRLGRSRERSMEETNMRIAVPLDEDQKSVCAVFARAPYFLIWDVGLEQAEILENPAREAEGGAGLRAAQFVLDCGANVLITPRCGENSAEVLKEGDVRIYKAQGGQALENIAAYREERLKPMEQFHAGFQGRR